ncbi:unnamed protein product [Alopecurus aequalis]
MPRLPRLGFTRGTGLHLRPPERNHRESKTSDGDAVMVSFWLVDPLGVSYFSVHCPGLNEGGFSYEPTVICAEGAFVLFRLTFDSHAGICCEYFVYRAGPGKPSLDLLPDPNVAAFGAGRFGILPACGDASSEHYVVAFLRWRVAGEDWQFDAHIFSSETQAWTTKPTLLSLSDSDKLLLDSHDTIKQIAVGAASLGWVGFLHGILLLTNLFDRCPVIRYIPFPEPKVCVTDEDGEIIYGAGPPEWHVTCSNNGLVKLVEIEFYDDKECGSDRGWIATTCTRMVSSDGWRHRLEVNSAAISVDLSYRALLPELWNDKTKKLELNKLVYYAPTLSMEDDDFVYMMAKVNNEDERAWVITVDMKRALAPFSTQGRHLITGYRSCAFPKYLDMATADKPVVLPSFPKYSGMLCLALLVFCWRLFCVFTGMFEDCRN